MTTVKSERRGAKVRARPSRSIAAEEEEEAERSKLGTTFPGPGRKGIRRLLH